MKAPFVFCTFKSTTSKKMLHSFRPNPGDLVVLTDSTQALIRYIGPLLLPPPELSGSSEIYGVELIGTNALNGNNDGSHCGVRYFECIENGGRFVSRDDIDRRVELTDFDMKPEWRDKINALRKVKDKDELEMVCSLHSAYMYACLNLLLFHYAASASHIVGVAAEQSQKLRMVELQKKKNCNSTNDISYCFWLRCLLHISLHYIYQKRSK